MSQLRSSPRSSYLAPPPGIAHSALELGLQASAARAWLLLNPPNPFCVGLCALCATQPTRLRAASRSTALPGCHAPRACPASRISCVFASQALHLDTVVRPGLAERCAALCEQLRASLPPVGCSGPGPGSTAAGGLCASQTRDCTCAWQVHGRTRAVSCVWPCVCGRVPQGCRVLEPRGGYFVWLELPAQVRVLGCAVPRATAFASHPGPRAVAARRTVRASPSPSTALRWGPSHRVRRKKEGKKDLRPLPGVCLGGTSMTRATGLVCAWSFKAA